jgi:hypothetical protein
MLSSQECLTRQQLDARNSVHAAPDYFQVVSNIFNDPSWKPCLTTMRELHPELEEPRELILRDFRTTRAKAKEKYDEMKKILHGVINTKWELSGNGGQQRSEDAEDYGSFDPFATTDGDNRRNFLPNDSQYYILYFWQRLEDEDCLQTTLAKLPDSMMANSDHFSITSSTITGGVGGAAIAAKKKRDVTHDLADKLASSIDDVASAIKESVSAMKESQDQKVLEGLNTHQSQLMDIRLRLLDVDENDKSWQVLTDRKRQLERIVDREEKKLAM